MSTMIKDVKAAKKAVKVALTDLYNKCNKFGRNCVVGNTGVRRSPTDMVQACEEVRRKCLTSYGANSVEYTAISANFTDVTNACTAVTSALATLEKLDTASANAFDKRFAVSDSVNVVCVYQS
jgi:hypothetical protein